MKKLVPILVLLTACAEKTDTVIETVPKEITYQITVYEESIEACYGSGGTVIYSGIDLNNNNQLDPDEYNELNILCDYPDFQIPDESSYHDHHGNAYGCRRKTHDHQCRKIHNE